MSEQPPTPEEPTSNPYAVPPPTTPPPPPPAASYPPPNVPAAPPPGYPAPTYGGYAGQPAARRGAGGLAITALVLAIAGGVLFCAPFLGLLLALAGLILGIVAWAQSGKNGRPKGIAIAATIVGALGFLVACAATAFIVLIWGDLTDCYANDLPSNAQEQCFQDRMDARFGNGTAQ